MSKLIETQTNSKYLIGIKFDKAITALVLIITIMNGYVKTFKVKDNTKTTVTSIYSLLAYENKYYLQVYLVNCAYKIVNKQMTDLS